MRKALWYLVFPALGLALAASVGWFVWNEPLEYWIDCNRFAGACTLTQKFIARSRTASVPIESLRGAEVRAHARGRGKPRQSVWVVSDRSDYFVADYRSREDAQSAAGKINAFLADRNRGRLRITQTDRVMYWVAWGLVPVLAAFGVGIVSVLLWKRPPRRDS
ncbi:MAG TPA: hypothetical protein VJA66_07710 [Thermoanaerobaculia bacterium]